MCKDQEKFQYFIGINQSIQIECGIKNANPMHVNYDWHFTNNRVFIDYSEVTSLYNNKQANNNATKKSNQNYNNDNLISRIRLKPKSFQDFGEIKCIAANEIGATNCIYELKLGGT